jgi:hypothetical protein
VNDEKGRNRGQKWMVDLEGMRLLKQVLVSPYHRGLRPPRRVLRLLVRGPRGEGCQERGYEGEKGL